MKITFVLLMVICLAFPAFVLAQTPQANPTPNTTIVTQSVDLNEVGRVLFVFLILSILFEVALTPIFTWKYFLIYCEGRGYKVPFTVILAFLVFWKYDLDIIKDLLNAIHYPATMSFWGQVVTSLLIAGGSDGIFKIFTKLGIRNPVENQARAKQLRADIHDTNEKAKGKKAAHTP